MEHIYYKGELMGIKFGKLKVGSIPLTNEKLPVQILGWRQEKGFRCKAHFHKTRLRITTRLSECFVCQKGKVEFKLYGPDKKMFKKFILRGGQTYLNIKAGHQVTALTKCEMFEVKNGPFKEDKLYL